MTDYRVFPATNGPNTFSVDASVNVGLEFYSTVTTWVKAIHFYRGDTGISGSVRARLWRVDSAVAGTALTLDDNIFTLSGVGWQTFVLPTPVQLVANQRYRAVVLYPNGYTVTGSYWTSGPGTADVVNGPLVAVSQAHSVGTSQQAFDYSAGYAYPSNAGGGANFWIDVTVTDVDPAAIVPPSIVGVGVVGRPTLTVPPPIWRLLAPTITEKFPIAGSLQWSKTRQVTVFGDEFGLFTSEEGALSGGGDEYGSIPFGTKYIWLGGHDNDTTDPAVRDLWLGHGFDVERIQ